ncbi:MAG: Maf family protein [Culicoidibacterales bacterium]
MPSIPIVLASSSPRRHELLKKIVEDFTICPSRLEEIIDASLSPAEVAMSLAAQKAEEVQFYYPASLIIGADTLVVCNDEILGKPIDEADAFRMLSMMSNNTQVVITGVSLQYGTHVHSFYAATEISFHVLQPDFIASYIQSGEPFDKAGGYGIQSFDDALIRRLNGSKTNVIGLPVKHLKRELETFLKMITADTHA